MKKLNQNGDIEEFAMGALITAGVLIVVAAIVAGIWVSVYQSTHHTQRTFTVTDKQAVATQGGHEYLIYTDAGTFKDTDSMINRKYNSSDVYGAIKVNHKYTCDTTGFRFGYTSDYPNIISCTEVK